MSNGLGYGAFNPMVWVRFPVSEKSSESLLKRPFLFASVAQLVEHLLCIGISHSETAEGTGFDPQRRHSP